jgi:predicted flap endonuclease-1-like 5' DNA nuclease
MEWYWWLFIFIIAILVVWWALFRNARATEVPTHVENHENLSDEPETQTSSPVPEVEIVPTTIHQADNLEVIEGIGPKIAGVLREAGLVTFTQLAKEEPENIRVILVKAGIRLADPSSWPEQAKLAAEGNDRELKALQDRLNAGREKPPA